MDDAYPALINVQEPRKEQIYDDPAGFQQRAETFLDGHGMELVGTTHNEIDTKIKVIDNRGQMPQGGPIGPGQGHCRRGMPVLATPHIDDPRRRHRDLAPAARAEYLVSSYKIHISHTARTHRHAAFPQCAQRGVVPVAPKPLAKYGVDMVRGQWDRGHCRQLVDQRGHVRHIGSLPVGVVTPEQHFCGGVQPSSRRVGEDSSQQVGTEHTDPK